MFRIFMLLKQSFNSRLVRPWMTACTSIISHCCQVNPGNCLFWLEETLLPGQNLIHSTMVNKTCSENNKLIQMRGGQVECSALIFWGLQGYLKTEWSPANVDTGFGVAFRAMRCRHKSHLDKFVIFTNSLSYLSLNLLVLFTWSVFCS